MQEMLLKFLNMCFKNRPEVGVRIFNANMKLQFERNAFKRTFLMLLSVPTAIFQSRRKRPAKASSPKQNDMDVS